MVQGGLAGLRSYLLLDGVRAVVARFWRTQLARATGSPNTKPSIRVGHLEVINHVPAVQQSINQVTHISSPAGVDPQGCSGALSDDKR